MPARKNCSVFPRQEHRCAVLYIRPLKRADRWRRNAGSSFNTVVKTGNLFLLLLIVFPSCFRRTGGAGLSLTFLRKLGIFFLFVCISWFLSGRFYARRCGGFRDRRERARTRARRGGGGVFLFSHREASVVFIRQSFHALVVWHASEIFVPSSSRNDAQLTKAGENHLKNISPEGCLPAHQT